MAIDVVGSLLGEKKEAIDVGAKFVWEECGCMCFNRESDGREKWRVDRKIKVFTV